MDRVRIDETSPDPAALARAVAALRESALVGYPTETFYGLGADPRDERAVDALFRAKARTPMRSIPLIASGLDQLVAAAGALPPMAARLAERFWPGPLAVVIPAWPELSPAIHGGRGTVAVRVPGNRVARLLCDAFGYLLTSTSANVSGAESPADADAVAAALSASLAVLLDGGRTPGGHASTIVDASGDAPRLVRAGATPWEQVLECLE